MKTLTAIAPLAILLAACSGDGTPVSYSAPVGITFPSIRSSDAGTSPMTAGKAINTESGNPYGAFLNEAKARIGRDPSSVAVTSVTLTLLGTSTNATALQSVFTGQVGISFDVKGTNTVYPVAAVSNPIGAGPVPLAVSFDFASLAPADRSALIQGQFDVVVSGAPATGFDVANAKADLQTVLTFIAYE